jgi:glutathione gamma-glutamylcysteinyltransferase
VHRADATNFPAWRAALVTAANGSSIVIASYDRAAMGQTGGGHFSPIGGYHAARDLVLILDVARFKYPPHWVPAEQLWRAMHAPDPATGQARGWITLCCQDQGSSPGLDTCSVSVTRATRCCNN